MHDILSYILRDINAFLNSRFDEGAEQLVLGHPSINGAPLLLTVAHIELERHKGASGNYIRTEKGSYTRQKPPLDYCLHLLFSARFEGDDYLLGLQYLEAILAFFQSRGGLFTPENTAGLDPTIEKLVADMAPLTAVESSGLWRGLGAEQQPSVLFRLRTLRVQEAPEGPEVQPIKQM